MNPAITAKDGQTDITSEYSDHHRPCVELWVGSVDQK